MEDPDCGTCHISIDAPSTKGTITIAAKRRKGRLKAKHAKRVGDSKSQNASSHDNAQAAHLLLRNAACTRLVSPPPTRQWIVHDSIGSAARKVTTPVAQASSHRQRYKGDPCHDVRELSERVNNATASTRRPAKTYTEKSAEQKLQLLNHLHGSDTSEDDDERRSITSGGGAPFNLDDAATGRVADRKINSTSDADRVQAETQGLKMCGEHDRARHSVQPDHIQRSIALGSAHSQPEQEDSPRDIERSVHVDQIRTWTQLERLSASASPTCEERVSPLDLDEYDNVLDVIDSVSAEVFQLTRSIALPGTRKIQTHRSECQVASSQDNLTDDRARVPRMSTETVADLENVECIKDSQRSPSPIEVPAARPRKRKTTGTRSAHFSPVKKPAVAEGKLGLITMTQTAVDEPLPTQQLTPPCSEPETTKLDSEKGADGPIIKKKRKQTSKKSDHFLPLHLLDRVDLPIHGQARPPAGVSIAPVPSIHCQHFGIIQEKLWQEPFWLLIAVILLNKTTGRAAIPTFWALKLRWPTIQALSEANEADVCSMIRHCGLQTARSKNMIRCAQTWLKDPPRVGKRYRVLHYPCKGDGKDLKRNIVVDTDSVEVSGALEIAHLPGCGNYAFDSWRIFCRDICRGVATDYTGTDAPASDFEPEWKRVLPLDKELRATLRWMWLREGYIWDCESGEKRRATDAEMSAARKGQMEIADADERRFAAQAVSGISDRGTSNLLGGMKVEEEEAEATELTST